MDLLSPSPNNVIEKADLHFLKGIQVLARQEKNRVKV